MLRLAGRTIPIEPREPCEPGCGDDRTPTALVDTPLEANVLVLDDGTSRVALISVDALYVGSALRFEIERRLSGVLAAESIFLAASHTHYAPMLDRAKTHMASIDENHLTFVIDAICQGVLDSLAESASPVEVLVSSFQSKHVANRRMPRWVGGQGRRVRFRSVFMGPGPAPQSPVVGHILAFKRQGRVLGYVWSIACHPTSLPSGRGLSSHYVGIVRDSLRGMVNDNVPVVFLQGFSGDLRPPSVAVPRGLVQRFRRLVLGAWFVPFTSEGYEDWLNSIKSDVAVGLGGLGRVELSKLCLSSARQLQPLKGFVEGNGQTPAMLTIHRVSVGEVDIVGVSAEPVYEFAIALADDHPDRVVIPVGCIDDTFGYAPTLEMMQVGGYESIGFLQHFGLRSISDDFPAFLKGCLSDAILK